MKTTNTTYRIVISQRADRWAVSKLDHADCKTLVSHIQRHVDPPFGVDLDYEIEATSTRSCSFCGSAWDVSQDDVDPEWPKGTPLCCHRAIEEFKAKGGTL